MSVILHDTEISTVMAALRHYQASGYGNERKLPAELGDIASNNGTETPLDDDQIDALCERINGIDDTLREAVALAITMLYHTHRADTLAAFTKQELADVVAVGDPLVEKNIALEDVYRRAWNVLSPNSPAANQ